MADSLREMRSILLRHANREGESRTPIEGLILNRVSTPSRPIHIALQPTFALVVQGEKSITLAASTRRYVAGDCLLITHQLPVVSRVHVATTARPQLGCGLIINFEQLGDVVARTAPPRKVGTEEATALAVAKAPSDLLDALLRLLRLLDLPEDIPALAPLLQQEIIYRLLRSRWGARLMQRVVADTASSRISKAMGWLRANLSASLRVSTLAKRSGMSESSFYHHFKAITTMTPVQYLKHSRLQEARRQMLVEGKGAAIAAYAVGYKSAAQFSRDYRRLFNRSPSQEMAEMRALAQNQL